MSVVGAVVIGRNEGARLEACLDSLSGVTPLVYVDSGSSDGSVEAARQRGAQVVELDMSRPFTAARARNAGLARLEGLDYVQFVDGDCVVSSDWIDRARAFLDDEPKAAVVAGRLRERHPEASIYNALCDREWDTPVGEVEACGGIAMMRVSALEAEGAFNERLIAGEEPELCLRLRRAGWTVHRIEAEMALHDAAMTRFSQFWKRARRAGYAFAEGAHLHGRGPERHYVKETRRALFWGAGLPLAIITLCAAFGSVFAVIAAVYPLQILRLSRRDGGVTHAAFTTVSKFAEARGVIEFHLRRIADKRARIIEYK